VWPNHILEGVLVNGWLGPLIPPGLESLGSACFLAQKRDWGGVVSPVFRTYALM
jgi:hypothetical protein